MQHSKSPRVSASVYHGQERFLCDTRRRNCDSSRAVPRVINRWSKIEIESHHLVKSEFNREMSSIRPVSFFVTGRTVYSFVFSECLVTAGVFLHCTPWRWVMQRGRNFGRSGRSFWKLSHGVKFLLELNKCKYKTTFRYKSDGRSKIILVVSNIPKSCTHRVQKVWSLWKIVASKNDQFIL